MFNGRIFCKGSLGSEEEWTTCVSERSTNAVNAFNSVENVRTHEVACGVVIG